VTFLKDEHANLTETCVESRRIYDGRIIGVRLDKIKLPDGRMASREVVEHKPAVMVLAENDRSEVLLIRQHRYPSGETLIELPAGITEPGEDFSDSAVRELREETGWKPAHIEKVMEFYSSPGFSDELLIMFYANGLTRDALPLDEDEFILAGFASRIEVEELITNGGVRDSKTLLALYWWFDRLNKTGRG
jgi:ADP-ribose pyrophosphatase